MTTDVRYCKKNQSGEVSNSTTSSMTSLLGKGKLARADRQTDDSCSLLTASSSQDRQPDL